MAPYRSIEECSKILKLILKTFNGNCDALPEPVRCRAQKVRFNAQRDLPYFPIPFKETETTAALKAIEASTVAILYDLKTEQDSERLVKIDLERTTAFLFQAYLATVNGLGKLDAGVKVWLKGMEPWPRLQDNLLKLSKTPIYYRRNLMPTDGCLPISTKPKRRESTTIYMALSKRQPRCP
jgi:hypothetical protein